MYNVQSVHIVHFSVNGCVQAFYKFNLLFIHARIVHHSSPTPRGKYVAGQRSNILVNCAFHGSLLPWLICCHKSTHPTVSFSSCQVTQVEQFGRQATVYHLSFVPLAWGYSNCPILFLFLFIVLLVEWLVAADLGLELNELLGHLVRGPLG